MSTRLKHTAIFALCLTTLAALASCHGSGRGVRHANDTSVVTTKQEPKYEEGSIVGTTFPNVSLITTYGMETTLRELSSTPYTLVALYRPSNEDYRNAINQLSIDRGIENAVIDGNLTVVLINMESDLDELRLLSPSFPIIWRRTALTAPVEGVPTPLNPTMYLLDNRWRVVQQRPDIESILKEVGKVNK